MREKFRWVVTLNRDDGKVVERPVAAYWAPSQEGTAEAVGLAAMAEAWWESGRKRQFAPIAVSPA